MLDTNAMQYGSPHVGGVLGSIGCIAACGQVASNAERCAPPPAGLVARWRGDMTAKDDTGRYDGTVVGALAYTPSGRHGSAFLLNGTTAAVMVPDGDELWPSGSFSVEGWVNAAAAGPLIQKYECGGACPGGTATSSAYWQLGIADGGFPTFQLRINHTATTIVITDSQHVITDRAWHYLAGVRDNRAKQMSLYLDGALAVAMPLSDAQLGLLSNTDGEVDPVVLGASTISNVTEYEHFLAGAIDEVAYFSSALTAEEVQSIFAAPDGECP